MFSAGEISGLRRAQDAIISAFERGNDVEVFQACIDGGFTQRECFTLDFAFRRDCASEPTDTGDARCMYADHILSEEDRGLLRLAGFSSNVIQRFFRAEDQEMLITQRLYEQGDYNAYLNRVHTSRNVDTLIYSLSSNNVMLRRNAALMLAELGNSAVVAIPALEKSLRDTDELIRSFAANALGNMGIAAVTALPALIQSLGHFNPDDHHGNFEARNAILGLTILVPSTVVAMLVSVLGESDSLIRYNALYILSRIDGQHISQAIPHIEDAMRDSSLLVRGAAVDALYDIRNTDALSALLRARCDSDPRVSEPADRAITYLAEHGGESELQIAIQACNCQCSE